MARTIGIGRQDFERIVTRNIFYVDKTMFIKEWWENEDDVTLITRPRRFGKTLNMSMLQQFFSVDYADRRDLFEGLSVWKEKKYRDLQGTYPVISISLANVKEANFAAARKKICQLLTDIFSDYAFLLNSEVLEEEDKTFFRRINVNMDDMEASISLHNLCRYLNRYYKNKVIILLDEYDTPMQEAYVHGYWQDLAEFVKGLFHATFITNPYMERAIMTGITRISKESIFSDMNNLEVVTTTSNKYAEAFGFTESEVLAALEEYGLTDRMQDVKSWYDGFVFGKRGDIYNPWSILNFLDKGRLAAYWANTSSNGLVSKLVQEGSRELKTIMEGLLEGKVFQAKVDEQIIFDQLEKDENAVWGLLLAGGYLKVEECLFDEDRGEDEYRLSLTNKEVRVMFKKIIRGWFAGISAAYNDFLKALLLGDVEAMNLYMNRVALATFSSFDAGRKPSDQAEPERFYHGFVLGLMVELEENYMITSNREAGFGRYDIMLEPKEGMWDVKTNTGCLDAIIIEFKVFNPRSEKNLEDTVQTALRQIEEMRYDEALKAKGLPAERIRRYGFAFRGKEVLIG